MPTYEGRPCAACKRFRGKCTHDCGFSPFFPPENTRQFEMVRSAYGASNVSRLLNDHPPEHRAEAAHSLVHDATRRHHDPVYASSGYTAVLQQNLKGVQNQHQEAKKEMHFWLARNLPQTLATEAREGTSGVSLGVDPQAYFANAFQVQHPLQLDMHDVGPESSNAATQRLARIAAEHETMTRGRGASGLNLGSSLLHSGDAACQPPPPQLQEQVGPTSVVAAPQRVTRDEERSYFRGGNASS